MSLKNDVQFTINYKLYTVKDGQFPSYYRLSSYIREEALLTGTKTMCHEGGCGICTVTVTTNDENRPMPVNSCLVPIYMCNGWRITTVEGLGNERDGYHPIQKALADNNGSQCGFCSPGFVMTMFGSAHQQPDKLKKDIDKIFDGTMCRCTGYRAILTSMQKCTDIEDIDKCIGCPNRGADFCTLSTLPNRTSDSVVWYRPSTVLSLRKTLSQHAKDRYYIMAGSTGSAVFPGGYDASVIIDINGIKELESHSVNIDGSVQIGCRMTLTNLIKLFSELREFHSNYNYRYLYYAVDFLEKVASLQIRNISTWAGNLVMKHQHHEFVSDLFVLLECIGAELVLYNCVSEEVIHKSVAEFLNLKLEGMYIEAMIIVPKPSHRLQAYKIMPRYMNAYALLSFAMLVKIDRKNKVCEQPSLVYGGISKDFVHAEDIEKFLVGREITDESEISGCKSLFESLLFDDFPGLPQKKYRQYLAKNLLHLAAISLDCYPDQADTTTFIRPGLVNGRQIFETFPEDYPLRLPTPKLDSIKQTAGESQFIDDMPSMAGQLYAVFVTSSIGCGEIKSIDTSEAESMAGVHRVITSKDIPGVNALFSAEGVNEPLLSDTHVWYNGQPIAIVVAESYDQAYLARAKVKIEYQNIQAPILTINDAIQKSSFFNQIEGTDVYKGDPQGVLEGCDVVIEGSVEVGEQYPMHMETQSSSAYIQEGYYIITSSTQRLNDVRNAVSNILGVSSNRIDVNVRRVGGGFGGKQTRSAYVTAASALASHCTQRPVKMRLSLKDNMAIIGRRNPFRVEYKLGASKDKKIQCLIAKIYENCGFFRLDSTSRRVAKWLDAAYFMPNWDVKVFSCKTNQPSHSYIRGPGLSSIIYCMEQIMDHLAHELKVSGESIREANMYNEGQITPHGQIMSNCHLEDIYYKLKQSCGFQKRELEIELFNKETKWRKKAIAMMPLKYGPKSYPGFEYLVHVMINDNDGSVTVIHGGVELGQGINTKVIQVVSKVFNIPVELVKVQPTSSVMNLHSVVTGGSVASDMNCLAVKYACEDLLKRLEPFRKDATDWLSLVKLSRQSSIDLHAKHHTTFEEMEDWESCVFGAACAEVELDGFTGNYIIHRIDILYDAGNSYSPTIDVGQIEGALVMGLGLYLMEEIKYDPVTGRNITNNTWTYKVPMAQDIPINFNVELINRKPFSDRILRSKHVGEAPLILADSVVLAQRKAITELRSRGLSEFFVADAPFTVEKILIACHE